MTKKNILVLITASYGGGAERVVLDQMEHYNKKKFSLHVVTLRKGNLENVFKGKKVDSYFSLNSKSRFSIKKLLYLKDYIKKNSIHLVHTQLIEADFYGFLLKILCPRIKLVSTRQNANDFRKKFHWGLFNKITTMPAGRIIAVSKYIKRFIHKYEFIPFKKIDVIPNSVDTEKFKKKSDVGKLKKKLGIRNHFVVGIVGRLNAQKGHLYLFEAVKMLKSRIPNIKVLVVGKGELEKKLKEDVKRLGIEKNVDFIGFVNDMPRLLSILDVFCLPSLFEGLSLALMEAMACECIAACSDLPNNKELVTNEINGFMFNKANAKDLSNALITAYKRKDKKNIGEKARKTVVLKYDFKRNLKKLENVYGKLIEK